VVVEVYMYVDKKEVLIHHHIITYSITLMIDNSNVEQQRFRTLHVEAVFFLVKEFELGIVEKG